MKAVIETLSSFGPKILHVLGLNNDNMDSIELDENQQLRIKISDWNVMPIVKIGFLTLDSHFDVKTGFAYFTRNISSKNFAPNNYFNLILSNQIGDAKLEIVHGTETYNFSLIISSLKTSRDDVLGWMSKISLVFPYFKTPSLMSPISTFSATSVSKSPYISLYSFINEGVDLFIEINEKLNSKNYFKKKYRRSESLGSSPNVFSLTKCQDWLKPGIKWKKSKITLSTSFKNSGFVYEPLKPPSSSSSSSYDLNINSQLLCQVIFALAQIQKFKYELSKGEEQIRELRSQFGELNAKHDLFSLFKVSIIQLESSCQNLILHMRKLGITQIKNVSKLVFDSRYKELFSDINRVDEFANGFRMFSNSGKHHVGLLGLDYIFEYFVYAVILSKFIKNGFEVTDAGDGLFINYYIKLESKYKDFSVRIFHDYHVPKSTDRIVNSPIWDYWKSGAKLSPDFIIHIYNSSHEKVYIFDAKYMSFSNCKEKINSFKKKDSVLVKYGTKFFLSGGNKDIPSYIGVVCCCPPDKQISSHEWLTDDNFRPSQQVGITQICSSDTSQLDFVLDSLVKEFVAFSKTSNNFRISSTNKPNNTFFNHPQSFNIEN